jgi:hypothetical protein
MPSPRVQQARQAPRQSAVRVVAATDFVVAVNDLSPQRRIPKESTDSRYPLIGKEAIKNGHLKPLGLDVSSEYLVPIDHHRSAVVDGLEKDVAEALDPGWNG